MISVEFARLLYYAYIDTNLDDNHTRYPIKIINHIRDEKGETCGESSKDIVDK